jgi:hypothetical protein
MSSDIFENMIYLLKNYYSNSNRLITLFRDMGQGISFPNAEFLDKAKQRAEALGIDLSSYIVQLIRAATILMALRGGCFRSGRGWILSIMNLAKLLCLYHPRHTM